MEPAGMLQITSQSFGLHIKSKTDESYGRRHSKTAEQISEKTRPSFFNPFKKRTIQACLGGCTECKVICSGMIAGAFQKVGYPIVPTLLPETDIGKRSTGDPYGSKLVMRHFSQIVPRDFDLSPNFEIVKYNITRLGKFNYKSIWAEK